MANDESGSGARYSPHAVHMMRTVQLAQHNLSVMADTKASILMGATFVIFTITIGQARSGAAPLPLLILGGAAFFSAILAVLAILPRIKGEKPGARSNLLFFGVFTEMEQEAFEDEIAERLQSDEAIYRTMARDIYQNGMVLRRKKYRMLSYAYQVFLLGLMASCAAYVIQHLI